MATDLRIRFCDCLDPQNACHGSDRVCRRIPSRLSALQLRGVLPVGRSESPTVPRRLTRAERAGFIYGDMSDEQVNALIAQGVLTRTGQGEVRETAALPHEELEQQRLSRLRREIEQRRDASFVPMTTRVPREALEPDDTLDAMRRRQSIQMRSWAAAATSPPTPAPLPVVVRHKDPPPTGKRLITLDDDGDD